ncbi:hypothetical protein [Protaetiibacter intestinalis]|uniref:Lipoprotein n=1 Tax=Protaetiibacter intestinalis TaxID=2419774 RepID=A0A387B8D2_9MICO|nr:hypothetical protein [Protaetiibacter intestinalis]AYF97455.1 hypothetical protein D7I47_03765 [Protaetiibacter intestinalis]
MSNRTLPTTAQLLTPIVGGAAVLLLAVSLTGCAQLVNGLTHVHEESFPDYAAAADGWVGVEIPAWIPDDATGLHNYATEDETQSIIRIDSPSDPVDCEPGDRTTMPFETPDWVPSEALQKDDGSLLEDALHCGDYQVIPYADGWVGWFAAAEQGQTPS